MYVHTRSREFAILINCQAVQTEGTDATGSMSDKPNLSAPPGACDTHMHIYEPGYAMAPTALLAPPDGRLEDYQKVQARLGLERVVIVQPTTYGADNSCTLDAMAKIGANARGVAVVEPDVSDDELAALTAKGVRGVRFHMLPGGALPWAWLDEIAARVADHGWHIQLQLDGRDLPEREAMIRAWPGELVIDHTGKFLEPVPVEDPAFQCLRDLVADGAWVKLSAPYETSETGPPAYSDVGALATQLMKDAPERMLWASNWPHPGQNPRPDDAMLMDTLLIWAGDDAICNRILADNPSALYGFDNG